ncbi:MAG: RdgB/HAM1 family non-canonical purine NTP pyrophosphatase [Candidatus Lindowbacteria bacterium]|nr:RdgB/HAM1 family non-canonical purine NTP pyrophosphatase [Candidatus Lindowbacteria bacterium]
MNQQARIFVASNNLGKIKEIRELFGSVLPDTTVVSANDIGIEISYPDEGDDYTKNALRKAQAAAEQSGLPSVADDSGLEVDALDGRPGVHSARYGQNDHDRNQRLLKELDGVAVRTARFRAVTAAVFPDGTEIVTEETWEGKIALEPQGDEGFGYDPVFIDGASGQCAAEMTSQEKSSVSHRGEAFRALVKAISDRIVR